MTRTEPIDRAYAADEKLRNGTPIRVRAILPDDKSRLLDHFAGLGQQSRYFRFFGHKRELTDQDLTHFTELDFDRHVGIAATLYRDGREHFIGVARYVRRELTVSAEIALAVLDEYQGEGIGPLLIHHLARIAHRNRVTQFEADVRGDNNRMLAVLVRSGCIITHVTSAGVLHFTLACPQNYPWASNDDFKHGDRGSHRSNGDQSSANRYRGGSPPRR